MRMCDLQRMDDEFEIIKMGVSAWDINKSHFWNLNPDDVPYPKLKRLVYHVLEDSVGRGHPELLEKYQGPADHVGSFSEFNDRYQTDFPEDLEEKIEELLGWDVGDEHWFIKEFDSPPTCEELLKATDQIVARSGDYSHYWLEHFDFCDVNKESISPYLGS